MPTTTRAATTAAASTFIVLPSITVITAGSGDPIEPEPPRRPPCDRPHDKRRTAPAPHQPPTLSGRQIPVNLGRISLPVRAVRTGRPRRFAVPLVGRELRVLPRRAALDPRAGRLSRTCLTG